MIDIVGTVFRLRSWRHYPGGGNVQWVEVSHPDKAMVGVFVCLGFERKDGKGPRIDPAAVIKELANDTASAVSIL